MVFFRVLVTDRCKETRQFGQGGGKGMQVFDALFVRAQNGWFALRDDEEGQTLVEYALIISLIALACIGALIFLSGKIQQLFSDAGNSLPPK
jgi:Flp pilus assembly pilin Flp